VWLQLILGAAFRHSGIRLLPHLIGAGVVFCMVTWVAIATLRRYRATPQLATPAAILLALLAMQITLGLASYITRVLWSQAAAVPLASMVLSTVAHVACGALLLATSVILSIQIHRHAVPELAASAAPAARPGPGRAVGA
jgi:heme A synthase